MLSFQVPDCEMTLEEGLVEFYSSRDDLALGRGASDSARQFFRCHDAAHVVFGCSTSLPNEAMVKIWSFFGSTAGLSLIRAYRSPESQEIYEQIAWGDVLNTALRSTVRLPLVLVRCLRMRKRWPWSDFDGYRHVRLVDIRREFGIRVLTAP